jgi:hypothetical protein
MQILKTEWKTQYKKLGILKLTVYAIFQDQRHGRGKGCCNPEGLQALRLAAVTYICLPQMQIRGS